MQPVPPAAARTPHSPPLRGPTALLGPEANRRKKPAQLCPCGPGTSEGEAPPAGWPNPAPTPQPQAGPRLGSCPS